MNSTLGIVVPVCNAESTLRRQVQELLEILPDVADNFRVLIVDEASSDSTGEIAHELATTYPQVQVVRHSPVEGQSAVQLGLDHLDSDLVLVQNDAGPLLASQLHAALDRAIAARNPTYRPIDSHLMQRLVAWGQAVREASRAVPPRKGPSPESAAPAIRRARTPAAR